MKTRATVGLLLGDILAQLALIAFEGKDMILSPESPVNEPRPRLDPEPKGATRSIRSASVPVVNDISIVEGFPDLAIGKTEAPLKIGLCMGLFFKNPMIPSTCRPHGDVNTSRITGKRKLGFEPTDREHEKLSFGIESRVPGTGKTSYMTCMSAAMLQSE